MIKYDNLFFLFTGDLILWGMNTSIAKCQMLDIVPYHDQVINSVQNINVDSVSHITSKSDHQNIVILFNFLRITNLTFKTANFYHRTS